MSYTEAQKKATYKWREKNRDLWNEARKEYNQTYLNVSLTILFNIKIIIK